MIIYLVCNSDLEINISFEDEMNIEVKKQMRPLSINGEIISKKLVTKDYFDDVTAIYTDYSASSISCAKYLADKLNLDINVSKKLHDCKIGELNNKTVKMLSYFQEHDFDFKLIGGESLNECGERIRKFIANIKENSVLFLPKRCIMAYLLKYADTEFNLDDKLILTFKDETIYGNEENLNIYKLELEQGKLVNLEKCI